MAAADVRLVPPFMARLGWRQIALLRRVTAAVLALGALGFAVAPEPGGAPVLTAAVDIPAGATVRAADLAVRQWPADLVPAGALTEVSHADGRVLAGAARAGEPLTDARLAGPSAALGAAPGSAAVAVRLGDAGVAALLVPGGRVDVVTVGAHEDAPVVLAESAAVLAVLPPDHPSAGRLVLIALPARAAPRVAAATLTEQVALTLRQGAS